MALSEGESAPDFEAVDQHGETVTLSGLLRSGPAVLFFYPKALSPGCTRETCHFRDLAGEFTAAGAQRVGISSDAVDRQAQFDERHDLGFPLLSDPDRAVARAYGVKRPGPLHSRRATFVVDTDGTILAVIASELNMDVHADRALTALADRG